MTNIGKNMTRKLMYGTVVATLLAAVYLLSSPLIISANAQGTKTETQVVNTETAIAGAKWGDNVTISFDDKASTFRFQSNGIPDHGFEEKYLIPKNVGSMPFADNSADEFEVKKSAEYFTETEVDTVITTLPIYSDKTTETSLGQIGVTLSGAQLFNDYENHERTIVALDDNVIHDHVPFVDKCNGHTLVDGSNYHYHGIPTCITESLDQEDTHSLMLGVLSDGFPVYGNQGHNGKTITNTDLDKCSGHMETTPDFPEGIYHYHLTADEAPYSIDCYHGEIDASQASAGPGNGGGGAPGGNGGPDLSSAAEKLGINVETLRSALGTDRPPNFEAVAKTLGISLEALTAVLPTPPQ